MSGVDVDACMQALAESAPRGWAWVREPLAWGDEQQALWRAAMVTWGGRLSWWLPTGTLRARVRDWCRQHARAEHPALRPVAVRAAADATSRFLRRAVIPSLSHVQLGRPWHAWAPHHRGRYPLLPLPQAEQIVGEHLAARAADGRRTGRRNAARRADLLAVHAALSDSGHSIREAARRCNVPISSAIRWIREWEAEQQATD